MRLDELDLVVGVGRVKRLTATTTGTPNSRRDADVRVEVRGALLERLEVLGASAPGGSGLPATTLPGAAVHLQRADRRDQHHAVGRAAR